MKFVSCIVFLLGTKILFSQFNFKLGYSQLVYQNDKTGIGNGVSFEIGNRSKRISRYLYNSIGLGIIGFAEKETLAYKKDSNSELELVILPKTTMIPIKFKSEINLFGTEKFDWYAGGSFNLYFASTATYLGKMGVSLQNTFYYKFTSNVYVWFNPELSYNFGYLRSYYWSNYKGFMIYNQLGLGWRFSAY